MADAIEKELGIEAELVPGKYGELSVWVGARRVAEKASAGFPPDEDVVRAVASALKG